MERTLYHDIWGTLPYIGFYAQELANRRTQWEKTAEELCETLSQKKNVGLIAPTGSGKTIIAGLAIFGLRAKTLFCAPQRYLCSQHANLFVNIIGHDIAQFPVVTGEIARDKRIWALDGSVIFATPNVAYLDVMRGALALEQFDLVVFDEVHHAMSERAPYYTPLAALLHDLGIPLLGLSASPG